MVPPGKWIVRWIDPATGRQLDNYEVTVNSKTLKLDIPGKLDHRVIHLEKLL